jgi:hypothetical protein
MSEVAPINQIARLEYVIREQMKEIDRLRDEVAQYRALMAAFEERGTLGILQMMAHDKNLPPEIRVRAAGLAVPFERPKLSVTATASVPLYDLLEERRRKAKVIEHVEPDPSAA